MWPTSTTGGSVFNTISNAFDNLWKLADQTWSKYVDFETKRNNWELQGSQYDLDLAEIDSQMPAPTGSGGFAMDKILLIGGAAVAAYLLLKK